MNSPGIGSRPSRGWAPSCSATVSTSGSSRATRASSSVGISGSSSIAALIVSGRPFSEARPRVRRSGAATGRSARIGSARTTFTWRPSARRLGGAITRPSSPKTSMPFASRSMLERIFVSLGARYQRLKTSTASRVEYVRAALPCRRAILTKASIPVTPLQRITMRPRLGAPHATPTVRSCPARCAASSAVVWSRVAPATPLGATGRP